MSILSAQTADCSCETLVHCGLHREESAPAASEDFQGGHFVPIQHFTE